MAAYFVSHHNEQMPSEYNTALGSGYGDVAGTYYEPFSSLKDMFHLFRSYYSNSPSEEEEFYRDSIALPYRREDSFEGRFHNENGTNEVDYEREIQPFIGCGNWLSGYKFYSNGYYYNNGHDNGCGEDFPHYGYYYNNGHDNDVEKTENIYQSDEWRDNYYEDVGKQLACDQNFWDEHWSRFGHGEEDCIEYGRQELKPTHSYNHNQDEMRFCEDIFGYWPCLYQRWP